MPWNEIVKGYEYDKGKSVVLANPMRVIKAKIKGKKAKLEEPEVEERDSGVVDLMARLRASLEEGSGKKGSVRRKTA